MTRALPLRVIGICSFRSTLFALIFLSTTALMAFAQPPELSVDEVVNRLMENNARRAQQLRSYRGVRNYVLDYQGAPTGHKHAEMTVRVHFVAPHQRSIQILSGSGSKLLLSHVLHKLIEVEQETSDEAQYAAAELSPRNYRFELASPPAEPCDCYLLHVTPLRSDKLLYDGLLWIDPHDFAVLRISARPARQPSFWINETRIEHRYASFDGFWLPVHNSSSSHIRLGGHALLTIDYQDYELSPAQYKAQGPASK